MKIDLSYLPAEDRMQLSLAEQSGWLITRSLLIKLVNAWIDKLQKIDLPDVGFSLGNRDIGQEHALSLEFDGPTTSQKKQKLKLRANCFKKSTLQWIRWVQNWCLGVKV